MSDNSKKTVILIHGGPGVSGYLAPLSIMLRPVYNVLEPAQRGSSDIPLTVKTHIDDLKDLITKECPDSPPILVGHSWGAMLALAFAAEFPDVAESLILIGCGTFDLTSRADLIKTVKSRKTEEIEDRLKGISNIKDPNLRFAEMGKIIDPIYCYDSIPDNSETVDDYQAFKETWDDMILCQNRRIYPSSFKKIKIPVVMIHGADDPHPGKMIFENLSGYIPHLKYFELSKCGHYPWREKVSCDTFYSLLQDTLRNS